MRIHISLILAIAMILGTACPPAAVKAAEDAYEVALESGMESVNTAGSYDDSTSDSYDESEAEDERPTGSTEALEEEGESQTGTTETAALEDGDRIPVGTTEEVTLEEEIQAGTTEAPAFEEEILTGTTDEAALEEENQAQEAAVTEPQNGIPVVIIEIDESEGNNTIKEMNASEEHTVKCTGTMQIIVPDGFTYCDTDAAPKSLGPVELEYIRGRGHTTWNYPKKPYRIKLDKKANVLGLGENKHWVLLANCMDTTLIKDRFVGLLGDQLGFEYTPNGVPVDVVMVAYKDGVEVSRENLGSYLLAEQIRVDKKRLDINELTADDTDPEDVTGGYLMAYGQQLFKGDPDKFYTDRGQMLANDSPTFDPEDDDYTNEQQKEYIRDHVQKMEDAIYGEGSYDEGDDSFADGDGVRYIEYMDMESAAKYWLLQELSVNRDAYGSGSAYFYKKADQFDSSGNMTEMGKICWGPLWDYDVSFGNGEKDENIEGFYYIGDKWVAPMLYDEEDEGLRRTAQRLWPEVRDAVLSALADGGLIDQYYAETKKSYEADYEIWKDSVDYYDDRREDYQENIEVFKQWTRDRIAWMDTHMSGTSPDDIPTLDDAICRVTYVVDGETVRREYYPQDSYCYISTQASAEGGFKPEKEGYVFEGWLDEEGNLLSGDELIEEDRIFTASFKAEDEAISVEEIIFRSDEEACTVEDAYFYSKYTVLPEDAMDKTLTWKSSDETIAIVDGRGEVRILATGVVTITATSKSGVTSSYRLQIVDQQPVPEDIVLDTVKIEMAVGEHAKISYRLVPSIARAEDIRFLPDDEFIVTTDRTGVVYAMGAGTATVTVQLRYFDENEELRSIEKECTVIVYGDEPVRPWEDDPDDGEDIKPADTQDNEGKRPSTMRDDTNTGDSNNPGLWILLALASMIGIGCVIKRRAKK